MALGFLFKGAAGATKAAAGSFFKGGPIAQMGWGAALGGGDELLFGDYNTNTNRLEAAYKGALRGAMLGGAFSLGPKAWRGLSQVNRRVTQAGMRLGPDAVGRGQSIGMGEVFRAERAGGRGLFGSAGAALKQGLPDTGFMGAKVWEPGWKQSILAKGIRAQGAHLAATAPLIGKGVFRAGRFAFEHPYIAAGAPAVAYGGYRLATWNKPNFESPTLGGQIQTNVSQYQAAMNELQGIPDVSRMMQVQQETMEFMRSQQAGTLPRTLLRNGRRNLQASTAGLPFGMHNGRHG